MRKIVIGLLLGAAAGVLDVIPMLAQKLPWDANLSAFSMWVVIGFFLSTSSLRLSAVAQGLLTSFLCLVPAAILVGAKQPASLIPIAIMTTALGCLLGWAVPRFAKQATTQECA